MKIVLKGGVLFTGAHQTPIDKSVVVVDGQSIAYAGRSTKALSLEQKGLLFDTTGMTVMPGMIDSHLHLVGEGRSLDPGQSRFLRLLRMGRRARQNLEAGFTTIRDVWAETDLIVALRQAIAEKEMVGPRIVTSGCALTITAGPWDGYPQAKVVNGCHQARRGVRELINAGVDLIKIMGTLAGTTTINFPNGGTFTEEELSVIVHEAHRAKKMVAAHALGDEEGFARLVKAGVDTIEHGGNSNEESVRSMAEQGIILVPTFKPLRPFKRSANAPSSESRRRAVNQSMVDTVEKALAFGVTIAMGTDHVADQHGRSAEELVYLVEAGLSPRQALVAATQGGSKACGLEDKIGTLEEGKLADIIVVDGDPLSDVSILQDKSWIRLVIKEGQVVVNRGMQPSLHAPVDS